MSDHYEKYKDTIKRSAKRNYRKREIWVNEYLSDKFCSHCGESEIACLKFYPHDSEIRKLTKRRGLNEESRKDIISLIEDSHVVCANCYLKIENDIIETI
jgi:hypothetical protein